MTYNKIASFLVWLDTIYRLKLRSVTRVVLYRIGIRTGINRVKRLHAPIRLGPYFKEPAVNHDGILGLTPVDSIEIFGWRSIPLTASPPPWFQHVVTGTTARRQGDPWWKIPDFDPSFGDIKAIWELSRFEWALKFARNVLVDSANSAHHLRTLNSWLRNWCEHNPPYFGPNWKCGQEASIRVLHLAISAILLKQLDNSSTDLLDLIELHLRRIEPTLLYAIGQDNNHGTSEAAALFVGAAWLKLNGRDQPHVKRWYRKGRHWLEERVAELIDSDGSFSQYSINYHRVMLDTLCIAEIVRQHAHEPEFSEQFYKQARAASVWLHSFLIYESGCTPNIGANDGARLLALSQSAYSDYRPTVQLAALLFCNARAIESVGPWDEAALLLNMKSDSAKLPVVNPCQFDRGGYIILRNRKNTQLFFRYPRYRFRPSHADAFHIDLWCNGINLLRDSGSYSYSDLAASNYFTSVKAHNSIQFDDRDQMPKLGRFLYGKWLKTQSITCISKDNKEYSIEASYTDWQGAHHHRTIVLNDDSLLVRDAIEGFKTKAVLRWRLNPGIWNLEGTRAVGEYITIEVRSSSPIERIELCEGYESFHYLKKTRLPVIEVEVAHPCTIESYFVFDEKRH